VASRETVGTLDDAPLWLLRGQGCRVCQQLSMFVGDFSRTSEVVARGGRCINVQNDDGGGMFLKQVLRARRQPGKEARVGRSLTRHFRLT
jgi:hypothetical protein